MRHKISSSLHLYKDRPTDDKVKIKCVKEHLYTDEIACSSLDSLLVGLIQSLGQKLREARANMKTNFACFCSGSGDYIDSGIFKNIQK